MTRLTFAILVTLTMSCKPQDAKTVQDVTRGVLAVEQAACVVSEVILGHDEPQAVVTACAIPPDMIQQVVDLITAQKRGALIAAQKRTAAKK